MVTVDWLKKVTKHIIPPSYSCIQYFLNKCYLTIYPFTCILCQHSSDQAMDLCKECLVELPHLTYTCYRCSRPLINSKKFDLLCGSCLRKLPPFDKTFALFAYIEPITKLIMGLKFYRQLVYARVLGELLAMAIRESWYKNHPLPDLLIPTPLHKKRLRSRGFNQAIEIARPIIKKLKIPFDTQSCIRCINTSAQAQLSAKERRKNLKNAFKVNKDLTGLHVAVIDDVITTGETMHELCKTIKLAGAKQIDVWCCARTILDKKLT